MPSNSKKASDLLVDVFGFGHCCMDYLLVLNPYPEKGKKGEVVKSLTIGGGPIPTALQCITRFGKTARFCGKVGDDLDGHQVIEELRSGGVDTSCMVIDPEVKTARAFIWIEPSTGIRTVSLDVSQFSWIQQAQLDTRSVVNSRIFFTDGRATQATLKGLRTARENGITTVFDSGSVRSGFSEMLPLIDYAVVSHDLAETCKPGASPSELACLLVGAGARVSIVTDGSNGAYSFDGKKERSHPGYKVDVYDTTGAGDVFHGGFIYGLLEGWDFRKIVRFANAAAALSCRRLSGRQGIPELHEVLQLTDSRNES